MSCPNCNCPTCTAERSRVKFWYDSDAECPLEWCGARLLHNDRYTRMGERVTHPLSRSTRHNVFPIYKLEHGSVAFSRRDFGDRWDSGLYGLLVMPAPATLEQATALVEALTQWCNGEVYGYTLPSGESCGGFFSLKEAAEAAANELGREVPVPDFSEVIH